MTKEEIEKEFEKYIDKMFKDRFIVDRKLFKWAGRKAFKKAVIDFWFSKLNTQKKDILEKIEKYEKFVRKELDNADEKDLTMIAYDMHSRLVAIKHIIKKLLT